MSFFGCTSSTLATDLLKSLILVGMSGCPIHLPNQASFVSQPTFVMYRPLRDDSLCYTFIQDGSVALNPSIPQHRLFHFISFSTFSIQNVYMKISASHSVCTRSVHGHRLQILPPSQLEWDENHAASPSPAYWGDKRTWIQAPAASKMASTL